MNQARAAQHQNMDRAHETRKAMCSDAQRHCNDNRDEHKEQVPVGRLEE